MIAIRVFATVGRYGNFTRAGQALGITQSAVSRHIATLESLAQLKLFERRGPTITLTPSGSQFYEAVRDAVATIELATQQMLQGQKNHERLIVRTSMPSFAMTVVVPMLGAFMESHSIQVDLITSLFAPQPQEEFDVLITRDLIIQGAESWELLREDLVCVGSPTMVAAHHAQALNNWPLIAAKSRPDAIPVWAVAKDISVDRLHVGAVYDHLFLAVAAAIGSAGLLVVPRVVVRDQLNNGTLVLADDEPVVSGATYLAYVNTQSRHVGPARDFCRWLKRMLRENAAATSDRLLRG
ncbi:LysR family transcriptional regulator [Pseudomonas yamanorum]|uniref:LysR family transcriptional regulator n=1 Tax=Pseudomonas yamanorum TaxID=515393 RepID=UPI002ED4639F|nr:LysR family transcriptional regulator [Pseudomonas yamanorum]